MMTKEEIRAMFQGILDDALSTVMCGVDDVVNVDEDELEFAASEASDYIAELLENLLPEE